VPESGGVKTGTSSVLVLDSWAVLAWVNNEPAAPQVRQLLRKARKRELLLLLSIINYGEFLYMIERRNGIDEAADTANRVDQLAVQVIPADRPLVFEAAHLKARYPISYADAFAAALAKRYKASVITGDREFKALEREVAIHWLR